MQGLLITKGRKSLFFKASWEHKVENLINLYWGAYLEKIQSFTCLYRIAGLEGTGVGSLSTDYSAHISVTSEDQLTMGARQRCSEGDLSKKVEFLQVRGDSTLLSAVMWHYRKPPFETLNLHKSHMQIDVVRIQDDADRGLTLDCTLPDAFNRVPGFVKA